jgi:hypothetical protein
MNPETERRKESPAPEEFVRQAEEPPLGLVAEFCDFLIHNKKWWLTPIILVMLLVAALVIAGTSPYLSPFMYPL